MTAVWRAGYRLRGGRPRLLAWLLGMALAWSAAPLPAELRPAEVGVLASDKGRESAQLARYYMKARGIPEENLLLLDVPLKEDMSRDQWTRSTRPAVRKWLLARDPAKPIRCLVTVWDIPLRIGPLPKGSPVEMETTRLLESAVAKCRAEIRGTAQALDRVLQDEPSPRGEPPEGTEVAKLAAYLDEPLQQALNRINQLAREEPKSPRIAMALRQLEGLHLAGAGVTGSIRLLEAQSRPGGQPELERARLIANRLGEFQGLRQGLAGLNFQPESVARDTQMLELVARGDGLLGALGWMTLQLKAVQRNETQASFDSELALVLWPEHALVRWLPNPLHWSVTRLPVLRPTTLMVARIDAPTIELARRVVDDSLAIEQAGLTGKVYLDARSPAPPKSPAQTNSTPQYDSALTHLAQMLKQQTQLEVVLDTSKELFPEGACPDAALYCGWYSLGKYRDSFTWRPGSVGFHVASGEASTLRKPTSQHWCKRMLEGGVAATLGPTYEPYLSAFPRPDEFFPLLLTGRLTLAEVYAATTPYQSWALTLIGDPLYTPYKTNPALEVSALPPHLQTLFGLPGAAPLLPTHNGLGVPDLNSPNESPAAGEP